MNRTKNIRLTLCVVLLGISFGFAQKKSTGDVLFFQYEYQKAVAAYEKQISEGSLTEQQYLNLADAYFETDNFDKASEAYLEIYKKDTLMDSHHYNKMLQSLSKSADKEQKQAYLTTMSTSFPKELMENMEFNNQLLANESAENELDYQIFNLEGNSAQTDFSPSFYNNKLLFTSARSANKKLQFEPGGEGFFNIYESEIQANGQVSTVKEFGILSATDYHKATPSYSEALNSVFYVLSNTTDDDELAFDDNGKNALSIAKQSVNGSYQGLLKDLSTSFYYPFYDDSNGKLYFAADFEDGYGGTDIYFVYTNNGQMMSAPINLGPRINSSGNEIAPFIFENSLYFASDVFYGLGGMDIYKANVEGEGFGIPINLGEQINTEFDDFGLIIRNEGDGLLGYFASNRPGGKGKDDIYGFKVDEKPGLRTITFKGKVLKPYNPSEVVEKAAVRLWNMDGEMIAETYSDEDGNYRIEVPAADELVLEGTKERFSRYIERFDQEQLDSIQQNGLNVEMAQYDDLVEEREGQKVVKTDDFYFTTSSVQLTPEITTQLDEVVAFVKAFPEVQLRIETYTDSRGGSSTNFKLTQGRSDAIKKYLVEQGVPSSSILYSIGYGEEKILNNCTNGVYCLEMLHKQNQRSLIVVLNDNVLFD
ncbi:OmpA family protein [Flagellimonas zhangzhouensis]|uniref:Outer membrane protein OmpA n=1 Tax=Flagellimonas zhangzhouensis TaxID=1073328 RepID=A0A1H2X1Z3_9FLAO|nr:OmpA family protein [Allomuricauda zhangzhouensis]SDQ27246.1 Outer membrane protein OmpA [Allomuricauda zhangzhouensis]SDW86900.1 Outer membrane protein OmpA [Allomuricauda zhangzhouensis]